MSAGRREGWGKVFLRPTFNFSSSYPALIGNTFIFSPKSCLLCLWQQFLSVLPVLISVQEPFRIFPLPCPAEEGVTGWLWGMSRTQAGPTHFERLWLNPLGRRRELSLEIPPLTDFLYKTRMFSAGKWRGNLSVHLHHVFLTNSSFLVGFEVQISGSTSKG